MADYLIDFQNINWENPAPGIRYKAFIRENQRIRLVEFSEELAEKDWCVKGHIGYVIEGSISIDFNGNSVNFKAGDGLFIAEGEASKHKGRVAKGEKRQLSYSKRLNVKNASFISQYLRLTPPQYIISSFQAIPKK